MPKIPPIPQGYVHPAFVNVLRVFRDGISNGPCKGASFAAFYKGELVVHLWGGFANERAIRPWKEDTMAFWHSCTKFIAAVCVAHLVERGLLDYEEKISTYWPEFAQNGKEKITLSTLLSHKAGLAALSENFNLSIKRDNPSGLTKLLAQQKPLWEPGKHHGYTPMVFGLYLDEIVRRVDPKERNISQYFQEEIAQPFDIDFHIGCPKPLQYRTPAIEPIGNPKERIAKRLENFQGFPEILHLTFTQPSDWNSKWKMNDPDFMSLPNSSSHGIGTSRAAAKFAGIIANGGKHEGKELLSPALIEQLQKPHSWGIDVTRSEYSIFGLGTMITPAKAGNQSWVMFGHSGYGGQNLMADTKFKVGWSFASNYIDPFFNFSNNAWRPLVDALYESIMKLEGITGKFEMFESFESQMKNQKTKL